MTPSAALSERLPFNVSIHARLATGDHERERDTSRTTNVSIHARLATGDTVDIGGVKVLVFQLTPALRRATTRRPPSARP